MTTLALILSFALTAVGTVDEAIELYLMGDMGGSITALEDLLDSANLSLDEQLRAYHRLGAAYYGLGETDRSRDAFLQVLMLDPYYELGLWENPNLMSLLDQVRQESMATVLVQGNPDGALIFMDGDYMGTSPYIKDNLIGGNTYTFTIHADGYEPAVHIFETQPGQLHTLTFQMQQLAAVDTVPDIQVAVTDTVPDIQVAMTDTMPDIQVAMTDTVPDIQITVADTAAISPVGPDIQIAVADTVAISPVGPDIQPDTMTPEELMELLGGGTEMAYLGEIGPLTSGASQAEQGSTQIVRDPTIFQTTASHIETDTGEQNRMIFSDVPVDAQATDYQTPSTSRYSSRTSEEIMDVLEEKTGTVTFIYNKHLRADPMLSGTVLIELVIEPSGRVSDVSIIQSSTYNPAFDLELAAAVETWRFGAVDEDEGALTVQYPFSFSR